MEKYKVIKTLGDGTFGSVVKAINKKTRQVVAIKKMKKRYKKWDQILNLAELKYLMKLHHPNIVKIIEIIKYQKVLIGVIKIILLFQNITKIIYIKLII